MKKTRDDFRRWQNKAVTLLGMSGVGKTTLAGLLPSESWFHYSGDYRIGTRYLNEPIRDDIKRQAMQQEVFRDLFRRDLIYIRHKISVDNLRIVSHFLGQIGDPARGGLSLDEFQRRQRLFRDAELNAMRDVAPFMEKARDLYHYPHFINDAGGSVCELSDAECWDFLAQRTVLLYIRADAEMEQTLLDRARANPKPMYYDGAFVDKHLPEFLDSRNLTSVTQIIPDEFSQWLFPKLIEHRRPKYQQLAERYGYTIDAKRVFELRDEADFIDLIGAQMARD